MCMRVCRPVCVCVCECVGSESDDHFPPSPSIWCVSRQGVRGDWSRSRERLPKVVVSQDPLPPACFYVDFSLQLMLFFSSSLLALEASPLQSGLLYLSQTAAMYSAPACKREKAKQRGEVEPCQCPPPGHRNHRDNGCRGWSKACRPCSQRRRVTQYNAACLRARLAAWPGANPVSLPVLPIPRTRHPTAMLR